MTEEHKTHMWALQVGAKAHAMGFLREWALKKLKHNIGGAITVLVPDFRHELTELACKLWMKEEALKRYESQLHGERVGISMDELSVKGSWIVAVWFRGERMFSRERRTLGEAAIAMVGALHNEKEEEIERLFPSLFTKQQFCIIDGSTAGTRKTHLGASCRCAICLPLLENRI